VRLHGWINDDNFVGHPKLEYLQQVLLDHFINAEDGRNIDGAPPVQTRIMVFAHFRDSAEEIARILKRHEPMIRPRIFVGQAHGKNSEGMSQKDQLAAIEKFKMGEFNTLIATSIGEEGLDIGEVDLIVCYDSKASPIRMLQRMGRTGRKRQGRIVMLQMQGKEENDANKANDSYLKMQELIANGSHFNFHDEVSRRILPPDVKPVVDRRVVDIPLENSQQQDWLPEPKKGRRTKKPPKKFHMPDNVITGFITAGRMGEEIVPKGRGKKAVATYLR
jgi:ERCC4-related helicase